MEAFVELNQLTLYSICLASFYMERVDIHALTKTNLFLLETKALTVETLPLLQGLLPCCGSNFQWAVSIDASSFLIWSLLVKERLALLSAVPGRHGSEMSIEKDGSIILFRKTDWFQICSPYILSQTVALCTPFLWVLRPSFHFKLKESNLWVRLLCFFLATGHLIGHEAGCFLGNSHHLAFLPKKGTFYDSSSFNSM